MTQTKNKRLSAGASDVCALVILFLACMSVVYQLFAINIDFLNPIIALIDDASGFMSILCVAFIIYEFRGKSTSYKAIAVFIVDLTLVNRLYSNEKWGEIFEFLLSLNRFYIAFIVVACLSVLFLLIRLKPWLKQREQSRSDATADYTTSDRADNPQSVEAVEADHQDTEEAQKRIRMRRKSADKERINYMALLCSVLVAIVVFAFLDDYFVNKSGLSISRPSVLSDIPDLRYIGFVITLSIVSALLAMWIFSWLFGKKSKGSDSPADSDNDGANDRLFRFTAVAAVIIEGLAIFVANESEILNLSDTFLVYITDDVFSLLIYSALLFVIIQIGLTVFFGLFFQRNMKNDIVKTLRKKIQDIEKKIVKIACDLLIGCLDLFDFLPDFFKTIGLLLLGKDPDANSNSIPQEQDPSDKQD